MAIHLLSMKFSSGLMANNIISGGLLIRMVKLLMCFSRNDEMVRHAIRVEKRMLSSEPRWLRHRPTAAQLQVLKDAAEKIQRNVVQQEVNRIWE